MKQYAVATVLLLFFTSLTHSHGVAQHPAYWSFTTDEGLTSNTVHDLEFDDQGYLWIATDRGVCRYDGYDFELIPMAVEDLDNEVFEIFKDHSGRLWFVHRSSRISYYQNGVIRAFEHNDQIEAQTNSRAVLQAFYVDSASTLYYSLTNIPSMTIDSAGRLHSMARSGSKWDAELMRIPGTDQLFYVRYAHLLKNCRLGLGVDTVFDGYRMVRRDFCQSIGHESWLFTYNAQTLFWLREGKITQLGEFQAGIHAISADSVQCWVGTAHGLIRLPLNATPGHIKTKTDTLFRNHFISAIKQDNEGGLWVSTLYEGVFYVPDHRIPCYNKAHGLTFDQATAIYVQRDRVLIGGKEGEINILSEGVRTGAYHDYHPQLSVITHFQPTLDGGVIFASTGSCVFALEPDAAPQPLCPGKFTCGTIKWISPTPNRGMILAGNDFLCRLSASGFEPFLREEMELLRTSCMLTLGDSLLLMGTHLGLRLFDMNRMQERVLTAQHPLFQCSVGDLRQVRPGLIAIATHGSGLLLWSGDTLMQVTKENGLLSNDLNTLDADEYSIWVGSDRGIDQLNLHKGLSQPFSIRSFDAADGLITNYVNQLQVNNGKVYVATNRGVSIFSPDNVSEGHTPTLVLEKIVVNNEPLSLSMASPELTHQQNHLRFGFTGIAFRRVSALEYRYRLMGLDTSWRFTLNRLVEYSSLPPGAYEFQLQTRLPGRAWNTMSEQRFAFSIQPPFWMRSWFLLAVFFAIVLLIRWRIHSVRKKAVALERIKRKQIESELKAIRSQMNPHFIFNSLNAIKHYILNNDTRSSDRFISEFSRFLRLILENSGKSYVTLESEIEMLGYYLTLEKNRFEDRFEFNISWAEELQPRMLEIPPLLIYPFVESAVIKGLSHLEGGGRLAIVFRSEEETLLCHIHHNGKLHTGTENTSEEPFGQASVGMLIARERMEVENPELLRELHVEVKEARSEGDQHTGVNIHIRIPCKHYAFTNHHTHRHH